jgi:anti-sigma-K factor RskA
MDYSRSDLADRLAAEYVLGTLQGGARRRFDALLVAHPALREAVAQWQERLAPLTVSVAPVAPPGRVWQGIESRLFGDAVATRDTASARWWQRLAVWRGLSAVTTFAALALVVIVLQSPPAQAPVVVVLDLNPQAPLALQSSLVASVSADGGALTLRPIQVAATAPGRALELWAVPAQGAPRSLGLVQANTTTTLIRSQLLADTAAFAISVEPAGGSPTGAPTGPIVSLGKLQT